MAMAYLFVMGAIFVMAGAATLIWPGPRRVFEGMRRFDDRHEWTRRWKKRQTQRLKRWESRPSNYWFIPVAAAVALFGLFVWLTFATERHVSGPLWGGLVGLLLVYGLARRPGTTLSAEPTQTRMQKGGVLLFGILTLAGGAVMLLAAFDMMEH